ncbi:MAG: extracellular solute-binding protein [Clostridia bacterium]|nr:extracellular solute-binding protein [Clostridia bacterium]
MKKTLLFKILLGSLIILFVVPHSVGAAVIGEWVKALVAKDYTILWDGEEYIPENPDGSRVYPIVYNGRTYLPLRNIAEKTGLDVNWDSSTKTIEIGGAQLQPKSMDKNTITALTYMTGSDSFTQEWRSAIEGFKKKNPGVKVIDESVPAPNDVFRTKIETDFAAGNEPDVAFGFTGWEAKPLVDSGNLFTWDEEIKKDTAWSQHFYKTALEAVKYPYAEQYTLPFLGYCEGVYYNKELFQKFNVKLPKNWNELLQAVEIFKKNGITPISVSFYEEPHYLIETFILSLGGREGHANPFDSSWAPALNYIKELYEKGAFPKDALTIKSIAANQLFIDQKAAMLFQGSWQNGAFEGYNDEDVNISDKVGIMPAPLLPNGKADPTDIIAGFGSGWFVSKPKNEAKDGLPVRFVKYLTTPEIMKKFVTIGGIPAIKCDIPEVSASRKSIIEMVMNANSINIPSDNMIESQAFKKIWKSLPYIVTGKTTAEQVIKEAKALNY